MRKQLGLILLVIFGLLAVSNAQNLLNGTCFGATTELNQSPNFENQTTVGPLTLPTLEVAAEEATDNVLCFNLTINNLAGVNLVATANVTDLMCVFYSNLVSISEPLALGTSFFFAPDMFNRLPTGTPFTTNFQVQCSISAEAYLLTVSLRVDNADTAFVENFPFVWPAPNFTDFRWAGQIFYQDVLPENSKSQCQEFNYSYTLSFAEGVPVDLTVATSGIDSLSGSLTSFTSIPFSADAISHQIIGNFVAPEGTFEFRMIAAIQPTNLTVTVPNPFSIELLLGNLTTADCQSNSGGLSTGELIGIIAGSVGGAILLLLVLYCVYHKFCKKQSEYEQFE